MTASATSATVAAEAPRIVRDATSPAWGAVISEATGAPFLHESKDPLDNDLRPQLVDKRTTTHRKEFFPFLVESHRPSTVVKPQHQKGTSWT